MTYHDTGCQILRRGDAVITSYGRFSIKMPACEYHKTSSASLRDLKKIGSEENHLGQLWNISILKQILQLTVD